MAGLFLAAHTFHRTAGTACLHSPNFEWHCFDLAGEKERRTEAAQQLFHRLQENTGVSLVGKGDLDPESLEKATETLISSYDWKYGGWGPAPKFPMPMTIDFLLSQAARGNAKAMDVAVHALKSHASRRYVRPGWRRVSPLQAPTLWLVPHFEKMLYDNAQLALAYLHAYKQTGSPASEKPHRNTSIYAGRNETCQWRLIRQPGC